MNLSLPHLVFITLTLVTTTLSAMDKPLLMEGKKTLFQRVLSIPDAQLHVEPDDSAKSSPIVPFSVYYVYQRQDDWLKVGLDSYGKTDGWLHKSNAIVWNQALTVSFRDPQDTQRVLLFDKKDALQRMVDNNDQEAYASLYQSVVNNETRQDNPVIAIQPEAHVDIRENFYLVPIKQHEDVYLGNEQARLLQVASVPLNTSSSVPENSQTPAAGSSPRVYRSGIHFVIDSTFSMGPYIDRTREAVRKVYSAIAKQGLNNQVNFALTAYRDNLRQVPQLDYLTRNFASLQQGSDEKQFFSLVDTLEPSTVSSKDYREDAYAGIKVAIENTDWSQFDARYVILITDAGPRESDDPLGATGLDAGALRQLAYDKGVSIWVLHMRSDSTMADHARAEKLYKQLSFYPGIGDFYYGVEMRRTQLEEFGNVEETGAAGEFYHRVDSSTVKEFGKVLEALANQITQQVLATTNGVLPIPIPGESMQADQPKEPSEPTQLSQLQRKVAKLGNALRMRYLQKEAGQPLPRVFDAWMVDRDFSDPSKSTVDVRVLLTRDQLSDLKIVLQQVLDLAEEGVLTPSGFLNDLKSLAASVSRDPSSVAGSINGAGGNLAEMGYMREYIEDLPYTGEVMNLSLSSWEEWSAKEQIEFMHRLESKISYYQALHDHTDLWVTPGGGAVNGNSVFPVVLNLLP